MGFLSVGLFLLAVFLPTSLHSSWIDLRKSWNLCRTWKCGAGQANRSTSKGKLEATKSYWTASPWFLKPQCSLSICLTLFSGDPGTSHHSGRSPGGFWNDRSPGAVQVAMRRRDASNRSTPLAGMCSGVPGNQCPTLQNNLCCYGLTDLASCPFQRYSLAI